MYLVLLVLPLLLFAAFTCYGAIRQAPWPTRRAVIAGSAVVIASAGVAVAIIASSHRWRGATEIAWTGVSTARIGAPLQIGGARQAETVGWPTGAFTPELDIRGDTAAGGRLAIRIARQTGFLAVGRQIVNGAPIPEGGAIVSDGFRLSWSRRRVVQLWITVRDSDGQVVATARIPNGDRDRTLPMSVLASDGLVSLRAHQRGEVAARLETWAATHWLLARTRDSRAATLRRMVGLRMAPVAEQALPRLVGESDTTDVSVDPRDTLSMLWSGRSQRFHLDADEGRVTLTWFAPWVRNSPVPPQSESRAVALVVCGSPLPGDTAFAIPFGGTLLGTRERLTIVRGRFGPPVETSPFEEAESGSRFVGERADTTVTAGAYRVRITALKDIPDVTHFGLILALGVVMMIVALTTHMPRLTVGEAWFVTGVTLTYWTLLLIRFLLAVRFALDPGQIDHLGITGFELAALSLTIMPGALLLAVVALRQDGDGVADVRRGQQVLWHAVGLFVAGAAVEVFARHLWPNLPSQFSVRWYGANLAIAVVGLLAVLLSASSRVSAFPTFLRMFERLVPNAGARVWESTVDDREPGRWFNRADQARTKMFWFTWGVLAVSLVIVMVVLFLLHPALQQVHVLPGTMLQEVIEPLLFFWVPAGLLLAAPGRGRGQRLSLIRVTLVIGVIVTSVLLLPVAVHSAGELLAAGAVLLSATIVLLAVSRLGAASIICLSFLTVMGVGVVWVFLNVNPLAPTFLAWGEMRPRVLAWLQGPGLMSRLPLLPLNDSSNVVNEQKINNAVEHVWENQALAQEGGFEGLGWGNAPTDRSLIRHDTVQFDSAFSFYIASEFGFWGGLALLLVYLTPLALLLAHGARPALGWAFAAAIASTLFIEAAAHALMNYGAMPFTGRDLPMLAVNSSADLWRWTALLFLLLQSALYWRTNDAAVPAPGGARRRALIIGFIPLTVLAWFGWRGWRVAERQVAPTVFDWTPMLGYIKQLAQEGRLTYDPRQHQIVFRGLRAQASGATLIELEVARFNALSDSEKADQLLAHHAPEYAERVARVRNLDDWDAVMDSLRARDDRQRPLLRPSIFRLVRRPAADTEDDAAPDSSSADTVSQDLSVPALSEPLEVDTNPEFNTRVTFRAPLRPDRMPRLTWTGATTTTWSIGTDAFALPFTSDSGGTTSVNDEADHAVWNLDDSTLSVRMSDPSRQTVTVRIGTLVAGTDSVRLVLDNKITGRTLGGLWPWEGALDRGETVRLAAGDAIRIELPRAVGSRAFDLVLHRTPALALIGPAWVRGEWINTFQPDTRIPWIEYLAHVLPREYERLGDSAASQYASLTLDESLQQAAQVFVDTMGKNLFSELLHTPRKAQYRLPPRVALSIVRLPTGEALGLGGWPRMSSQPFWFRDPATHLWVPPVSFIDARAPASIRAHYGTDRNFDPMAMGSSTKPLWASIVLALHHGLERRLAVTGDSGHEDTTFGIGIGGRGWQVERSVNVNGGVWCDLTSYLARSDNRYQVRLGLLGLAEPSDGDSGIAVEDAVSPSRLESMDEGEAAWHKYPRFPASIAFSYERPHSMMHLDGVPLAERWRSVFGIETRWNRHAYYRRSFWTGDEGDDRQPVDPYLSAQLDVISPRRANFAFDSITSPRQYVTLLIGGGTNAWANVDFAAAFASAITGQIVMAHITPEPVRIEPWRLAAPREAALIRSGTNAVLTNPEGTAYHAFQRALPELQRFGRVYAKTGTLAAKHGVEPISRIVLAVVRWSPDSQRVRDGLVFSLAVERGGRGTAQQWLADFVVRNDSILRRILATPSAPAAPLPPPSSSKPVPAPVVHTKPQPHRVEPIESYLLRRISANLYSGHDAANASQFAQAAARFRQASNWVDSLRASGQNPRAADSLAALITQQRNAAHARCVAIANQSRAPSPPCP